MAGDWIKMRSGLYSDPKVVAIATHLLANQHFRNWALRGDASASLSDVTLRYCVTGALHNAWCNVNEHSRDGVVDHAQIEWIDNVTGVPGLGESMQKVGWVQATESGLVFPNFNRHNTSGAERQKKYRDKKRNESDVTRYVTRDVTLRPREEKRREEKSINKPASAHSAFEGITKDDLSDPDFPERFVESQQAKASPVVDASEATRHNVRAAAAKAVSDPSVQNPPAIFAWIVSGKRWDYLRSSHDDIAKAMKRKAQPRGEPAIQVPIKSLPDDHGPNNLQAIRNLARCIA